MTGPRPNTLLYPLLGPNITLRTHAWIAVLAALLLSILGVYAVDLASTREPFSFPLPASDRAQKQIVFLLIALAAGAIMTLPQRRVLVFLAWPAYALAIASLVFLFLPFVPTSLVRPINGARAWITLPGFSVQPAEFAKIAFVLAAATYLRHRESHRTFLGLIVPGLITVGPVALITLQPDLGSAMLFVPAIFALLLAAGARYKHLLTIVVIALLAAPAAYPFLRPHQKDRLVGIVHIFQGSDEGADDINYQPLTAKRVAGAGGIVGMSDEKARAVLYFNALPERHNDMIFPVIITRFGLVGGLATLALYMLFFLGATLSAAAARDPFHRLVVVGITALIGAQTAVNMGMALGVLPIIGITLPFVSAGGSSLIAVWIMTGLIVNAAIRKPPRDAREAFDFQDQPFNPDLPAQPHRLPPKTLNPNLPAAAAKPDAAAKSREAS